MAKVILHMGTHKTATTTLQDTFHANRDVLARHGVIYPALGKHTGHHGLLMDWIALPPAYCLAQGGTATLRSLAEQYVDTNKTLLLSSEEFSRAGGPGGRVNMAALRAIFDGYEEVRIILCLRTQWQFLQSTYLEISRDRRPPAPPDLVADAIASGQVDGLWCNYDALYDQLCASFDPSHIRLMDFDTACAHDGGVVGAMLEMIGTSLTCADLEQAPQPSNVSAPPLPVWAAMVLLSGDLVPQGADGLALTQALATALDLEYGAGRPGSIFSRAEHARLAAHFSKKNAALAARVGLYQPDFVLSQGRIPHETLFREDLGMLFWVRAARRIYMAFTDNAIQAGTGAA